MRLADKTVLITGAGSGWARLACQLFPREGARIVAVDLAEAPLRETAASVESEGGGIVAIVGNVAVAGDVERAVAEGVRAFGKLHVLYNNAGIFPDEDQSVADMDEGVWQRVLDVNLKGVALCCKYGIPELIKAGGGRGGHGAPLVAPGGGAGPDADDGVALPERGGAAEAAEPHSDGPLRPGGGRGLCRPLPRLRRVVLDHRPDLQYGLLH